MKKRSVIIVLILALLIVGGVFVVSTRFKPSAPDVVSLPIRIANVGQYSILNLLAQNQGYFAENGLIATVTEYDSGATSMAALLDGRADVAMAADFVGVANLFSHPDLTIIARGGQQDNFHLVARKDKGIAAPGDLKGKKVGVTRKTAGELYLTRFLSANDLSIADIDARDLRPAEMVSGIQDGSLDAVLIFDPHAYKLRQTMGANAMSWLAQGNQRAELVMYTTRRFTQTDPEVLIRYLRALSQAEKYVRDEPAAAKAFVAKALAHDPEYVEYTWDTSVFGLSLSQDLVLTLESQARWMIEGGLTTQTQVPNYLGHIWFDGLEAVVPENVTILH